MWPFLLISALLLSIWLNWCFKNRRLLRMARKLPGPPALPIVGNAMRFMVHPQEFVKVIRDLITEYGDVLRVWLGTDLNIIVSNPEDVKLLLTSSKTSVKGPQYKYMADFLGEGILTGSGTPWRKHRKIATPNFGKRAIESYTDIINRETDLLVQKYKEMPKGQPIDIYNFIVQTTSYVVCQTLMGLSKKETLGLPYLQHLIEDSPNLYDLVFDRMTKWYLQIHPVFWVTKYYRQQKQGIYRIHKFSEAILKHSMEKLNCTEKSKKDILLRSEEDSIDSTQLSVIDRFILSQELDPTELIQETFTVFTASQEASAKVASFALLMMAYHPKCQEKLYAEIVSVIGKKERLVTCEDIKQMPYLHMVFKEVIRLFPTGAMLQRTVTEDVTISSCTIPAGSSLVIPLYHMQRDPKYWLNPDAFDPERFSAEKTIHRSYIPFSIGSMDCLGRHFADKLVKTIVIKVMQSFKLTTFNEYKNLRITIAISATTMDGFPAILMPRCD